VPLEALAVEEEERRGGEARKRGHSIEERALCEGTWLDDPAGLWALQWIAAALVGMLVQCGSAYTRMSVATDLMEWHEDYTGDEYRGRT